MTEVLCRLQLWLARPRGQGDERGAALVEYALLVMLVAVVCIVAVAFFGGQTSSSFRSTGNSISAAH